MTRANFSAGPVAQRIRHLTTNQGIAGSNPARVKFTFDANERTDNKKSMFPAEFEPATLCVWSTRDNHYTKETYITSDEITLI